MSGTANQLVCNGCLEPIELGRSFTWVLGKPYHNHCANYTDLITRAEAEAMVVAEREVCTEELRLAVEAARADERLQCARRANAVPLFGNSAAERHASLEMACAIRDAILPNDDIFASHIRAGKDKP